LSAGTFTVTVTDRIGCTATASVLITEAPALGVTAVLARGATCPGTGIAIAKISNGVSSFQFSWSPGGSTRQQPVNLDAGTYTVLVTDHLGCTATASVAISQAPVLTASISRFSCSNHLTTATVSAGGGTAPYTYIWNPGGGTKATLSGLSNGSYTITVTDASGCSAIISQMFSCTVAPGRNEGEGQNQECCSLLNSVSLYPNPNSGQFILSGLTKGMLIQVYDYTGRTISNITAGDETMQFNLADQSNGIYLIRILNIDGTLVSEKKVVKTN
jgi:hypothetical protein